MQKRTVGTIISVKKQWWLKINTKAFRSGPLDGALFPHIVRVKYRVDGVEYIKCKWIGAAYPVPVAGDTVQLVFEEGRPEKVKILYDNGGGLGNRE